MAKSDSAMQVVNQAYNCIKLKHTDSSDLHSATSYNRFDNTKTTCISKLTITRSRGDSISESVGFVFSRLTSQSTYCT